MESKAISAIRIVFYSVWAVVLTAVTYVLGAAPLKVLRMKLGRTGYWILGVAISAAFISAQSKIMGIAFFSLVLLMGVFDELEEVGFNFMVSGFFTLLINTMLGAGAFALWVSRTGSKWSQIITGYLEEMQKPLAELGPHFQINSYDLMVQLPSVIIVLWIVAIYLAVILEGRLNAGPLKRPPGTVPMRAQLALFRLPDPVVWLFIASLLGAFGGFAIPGLEAVSVNVMNVCMTLLFFQGLAVVLKFCAAIRMGPLLQIPFMILLVVYLFLFVALLGLMDYWLDFRSRLAGPASSGGPRHSIDRFEE